MRMKDLNDKGQSKISGASQSKGETPQNVVDIMYYHAQRVSWEIPYGGHGGSLIADPDAALADLREEE